MADVIDSGPGVAEHRFPSGRARFPLTDSFSRNAYALMLNTGVNGALGLVFWFVAARQYSPADVGRGSALISAFTLISAVVGINLTGTLARFLPRTGRRTTRFVLHTYWASSAIVLVLALAFVATLPAWGASFDLLRRPGAAALFVLVVVLSGIFTVQDGVLVGLRSSVWVPVENTAFGIAKIVLLVLFAVSIPAEGVYLSFVIAMAAVSLPINWLIFGRLLRRDRSAAAARSAPPSAADVRRFLAGDYLGALFGFGTAYLIPVLVAGVLLPSTFAAFYIVWMIWGSLQLIPMNLAQSLTVEGGFDEGELGAYTRTALKRAGLVLLAAAVVLIVGGPLLLRLLGPGYVGATALLQLLALAAFPRAVFEVWLGVLRAQGRARTLARVQIISGVVVVGAVALALPGGDGAWGLGVSTATRVGVVILVVQTAVTCALLPGLRRFLVATRPTHRGEDAATHEVTHREHRESRLEAALTTVRRPYERLKDPQGRLRSTVESLVTRARSIPAPRALVGLTALALLAFWLPLLGVDLDAITGLGLISVLPILSLAGIVVLGLAFVLALALRRQHRRLLGVQLAATIACLHGVTPAIEALPRFPVTWVHLGMVEYIQRIGAPAPDYDARFSWPGFFAFVAFVAQHVDPHVLQSLVAVVPLVSNLAYVLALGLALTALRTNWRAKWLALWIFAAANWIGQDYFSPQGLNYFLYLVFVAVLLAYFRPPVGVRNRPPDANPTVLEGTRRVLRLPDPSISGDAPPRPVTPGLRAALLVLVLLLFFVSSTSHQLTPFVMVGACVALVLARRCVLPGLPLILAVGLLAWLSYMAAPYWTGHLGDLLSGVGDVGGILSSGVAERTAGDPGHQLVVVVRVALSVTMFGLAGLGLWRRARRGIDDRIVLGLLVVPVVAAALQSYGGEIVLRVYFFALPALCILVAFAAFPEGADRAVTRRRLAALGVCVPVLLSAFFVARYGNESYERVRSQELAAAQAVYDRPGPSTVLFPTDSRAAASTPFIPLGYRDIERVRVVDVPVSEDPRNVGPVVARMRDQHSVPYLMVTRGQQEFLTLSSGYPSSWGDQFRAALEADPGLTVVTSTPDAEVFALRSLPPWEAVTAVPPLSRGFIGKTPWTPSA